MRFTKEHDTSSVHRVSWRLNYRWSPSIPWHCSMELPPTNTCFCTRTRPIKNEWSRRSFNRVASADCTCHRSRTIYNVTIWSLPIVRRVDCWSLTLCLSSRQNQWWKRIVRRLDDEHIGRPPREIVNRTIPGSDEEWMMNHAKTNIEFSSSVYRPLVVD